MHDVMSSGSWGRGLGFWGPRAVFLACWAFVPGSGLSITRAETPPPKYAQKPGPGPCANHPAAPLLLEMGTQLGTPENASALEPAQVGPPSMTSGEDLASGTSVLTIYDLATQGTARSGDFTVTIDGCSTPVRVMIELGEPDGQGGTVRQWTFYQDVTVQGAGLAGWGTITVTDASGQTTYNGGWTWSPAAGAALDGASDAGFLPQTAAMLNISAPEGGGFSLLGSILVGIGNIGNLLLDYLLDIWIPYTPPTSCDGPSVDGDSCGADDVPCRDDLGQDCVNLIDSIPGVSDAFKKCMKGRCGCGGSRHDRIEINCASSDDCGPCGDGAWGCNMFGDDLWYCIPDFPSACEGCLCTMTAFHEMAHACGSLHNLQYLLEQQCNESDQACEIGEHFSEEPADWPYPCCDSCAWCPPVVGP